MWNNTTCELLDVEGILDRHDRLGTAPDPAACRYLLKKCGDSKALEIGKRVHLLLAKTGRDRETLPGNLLVQMYGKCGSLDDAERTFQRINEADAYSWNILIDAYAQNGRLDHASELFAQAPVKNAVSWNQILRAYTMAGNLFEARRIFDEMPERNAIAWTTMVTAYAQYGHIFEAREVFAKMPYKDCVAWNAMIAGYSQSGNSRKALESLRAMDLEGERPNAATFLTVVDAIARSGSLIEGRIIHGTVRERGFEAIPAVANVLIAMYAKCGGLASARTVFATIREKDVISWTALIGACAKNGHPREALDLLRKMIVEGVRANRVTLICALDACGDLLAMRDGETIHHLAEEIGLLSMDVVLGTALIDMYGKCGRCDRAEKIFLAIEDHNLLSFTAMIAAYAASGLFEMASRSFKLMDLNGLAPNRVTTSVVIQACAARSALEFGAEIHSSIDPSLRADVMVSTALIDLYGKCGRVDEAAQIFTNADRRNSHCWTSMIECYARNGSSKRAMESFQGMALEGLAPDEVSLISILAGCSHGGLLGDGIGYFLSIRDDFHVDLIEDHYSCVVDMLGRAGNVEAAENLAESQGDRFAPRV